MRDLNYQLKRLGARNKDGSLTTQAQRAYMLSLIADQLHEIGYRNLQARNLRGKHVQALVAHWQQQGLAAGTMKNRMAALRWWAEKVGREHVLSHDNTVYGIPPRQYVATTSKAQQLGETALSAIREPYVRMSLELQQAFGLRRQESLKFQPTYADQGDHLRLKGTWTKGGKARLVPVRTEAQHEVLGRAHCLAGRGSLIPSHRTYIQHLKVYEYHTSRAGLHKLHGLRHAYAQQRYAELTGWLAPAAGGPTRRQLSPEQKVIDREVRLTISRELGHEREQITTVYLGR
jgi:site-specific recombinase XerD